MQYVPQQFGQTIFQCYAVKNVFSKTKLQYYAVCNFFPHQLGRIASPNDFAVLCSENCLLQKETAVLCSETVNANQQRMKKLQIAWEFISLLSHSQIDKNEYQNTKTRKLLLQ